METRLYKKIYGTVLYYINQLGFEVELGSFIQNKQFFTIKNKTHLKHFYFILSVDELNTNTDNVAVKLYALGKYIGLSDQDLTLLDAMCWLRYVVVLDNSDLLQLDKLENFINSFSKNKKYYFYNCWIREYNCCKKLSRVELNRFYKSVIKACSK